MIYVDKAFADAVIAGGGFHEGQTRELPWVAVLEVVSIDGHVAAGLIDTDEPIPDDNSELTEFIASHRVIWRA